MCVVTTDDTCLFFFRCSRPFVNFCLPYTVVTMLKAGNFFGFHHRNLHYRYIGIIDDLV